MRKQLTISEEGPEGLGTEVVCLASPALKYNSLLPIGKEMPSYSLLALPLAPTAPQAESELPSHHQPRPLMPPEGVRKAPLAPGLCS